MNLNLGKLSKLPEGGGGLAVYTQSVFVDVEHKKNIHVPVIITGSVIGNIQFSVLVLYNPFWS